MNLVYTGKFKKDFKRSLKRGKSEDKLFGIIDKLMNKKTLPEKCRDHPLGGNWSNRRECHIEPDWLLIYYVCGEDLILERMGSHSDLYR